MNDEDEFGTAKFKRTGCGSRCWDEYEICIVTYKSHGLAYCIEAKNHCLKSCP